MSAPAERTDAELVAGVLTGDRAAFAAVYDRYADRLYDFCCSVLRDRHEAADAVQDTFVLVAERLGQLNDPDRLRPWLYAVARSVALRRIRSRRRVVLDVVPETEVNDMAEPGPQRAAEVAELRELVWSAAAGLSDRDRALLDLHLRHGLDGADLGEAMGVSAGHAYVLLTRLRDQVERSLGALLIARQGRSDCATLRDLLAGWDGRFSPLLRKRVARHVDRCEVCGERRRTMVSPLALLAAIPLVPAPVYLRDQVLDRIELVAYQPRTRRPGRGVAAAVVVLLIALGAAAWWNSGRGEPGIQLAEELPGVTTTPVGVAPPAMASTTSSSAPVTTTGPTAALPGTTTRPTAAPAVTTPRSTRVVTTTTTRPAPVDATDPVVVRQAVSALYLYQRGCPGDTASVSATVTDDSAPLTVVLHWTESTGQSGSREMAPRAGQWYAPIGPFDLVSPVTWHVSATDPAGNTGTGPVQTLRVSSCQIG